MSEKKIKLIIADDEILFRQGLLFLLRRESNIDVIFDANNGKELLEYLDHKDAFPDIILMDLNMPETNGVEATKKIHELYPQIKIVALTSYNTKPFIVNMIQSGACAFLKKNTAPPDFMKTISEVQEKGFFYHSEVMEALHQTLSEPKKKVLSIFDENYISKREKEVLELICRQYSTAEIAAKLFISPRTVEGHRNNLLLKTESKNTAGLVVYAIQNHIVDLEYLKDKF